MLTLGARAPKKWASEPRALFSESKSSSWAGISLASNHSVSAAIRLVLPTPPLPPIERITRFSAVSAGTPRPSLFCCDFMLPPSSALRLQLAVDQFQLLPKRAEFGRGQRCSQQTPEMLPLV